MENSYKDSAKEIVGFVKKKRRKCWIKEDTLQLVDECRQARAVSNTNRRRELDKQVQQQLLDGVPGELIRNAGPSSMRAQHTLCTKIWESGEWPEIWKSQEFMVIYKTGNSKECSNYRTIALISHASKIILQILLNRMRKKIEMELPDEQAGFRPGRGTADMLVIIQVLIEKVMGIGGQALGFSN